MHGLVTSDSFFYGILCLAVQHFHIASFLPVIPVENYPLFSQILLHLIKLVFFVHLSMLFSIHY